LFFLPSYLFLGNMAKFGLLVVVFFLTGPSCTSGQALDTLKRVLTLGVEPTYATADHVGNVYVVRGGQAIEKYSVEGILLARYTNNRLGKVGFLDVTNPQKVVVWYGTFSTVIWLDRNLTELGGINLIEWGFPEVRVVGASRDGNLWVYDEVGFRLCKLTPAGGIVVQSQPLNMLLPVRPELVSITEEGGLVFANDPVQGTLIFDFYGQFRQLRPVVKASTGPVSARGGYLMTLTASTLVVDNLTVPVQAHYRLPEGWSRAWLSSHYFLASWSQGLSVYVLPLPGQ
jgi:hypothetical protein